MTPKPPIRVLHVCTIFLTARTFIAPVLRYLRAHKYEVAVACSRGKAEDGPEDREKLWDLDCPIYPVSIVRTIRPVQDVLAVWRLFQWIRQFKPDIIHTQTSKAGIVGRLAARLAGVPIVIHTAHAFPFHAYLSAPVRAAYIMIERMAARWADCVFVDTESVRQDGLRAGVVEDPSKLVVVPMGINVEQFSPAFVRPADLRESLGLPSESLVVGTVARLVPDKGLECFLRMAALIVVSRQDTRFLIVGEGPLREELARQARELRIDAHVVFAGHRTDIPDLMALMDVFVLPTRREGFGVVFAEAMAMERPTVGSRIGPVAEVVEEGVTGYLAPPDMPEEFAARVLALLADPAKRRMFGQAGRRRVERLFSEEVMCWTIEGHYRRLLATKGLA
ncbi:MAG: glycosyltransferase family 4 protein [Nitrospira sp.]|nr:glycosyltransferase family 4 protein [Nitrospira sp.]